MNPTVAIARASRFLLVALLAAGCSRGGAALTQADSRLSDDQTPFVKLFEPGQRESLLYVWTRDAAGGGDFIAIVDADPASATYGQVVSRAPAGSGNNEAHHFGYTEGADRIFAGGISSNRMFRYDVGADARQLQLSRTIDLSSTGFSGPHTAYAVPGGVLVTMMGGGEAGTGALVELDNDGAVVRTMPAPTHEGRPVNLYDVTVHPATNLMLTTGLAHHEHLAHGPPAPEQIGNQVVVWDWGTREVKQVAKIDAGAAVLRPLRSAGATGGFVNALFGNSVWYWEPDGSGSLRFERVLQLPDGSLPADMRVSPDDRHLFVSLWAGGKVQQYDITDPRRPRLVGEAEVAQPNMMKLSPDGQRLYVTNSLLSSLDGDVRFGAWLFHVGPNGLTREPRFAPDFQGMASGRAGPHDILLR